jgi:hypothetical protein
VRCELSDEKRSHKCLSIMCRQASWTKPRKFSTIPLELSFGVSSQVYLKTSIYVLATHVVLGCFSGKPILPSSPRRSIGDLQLRLVEIPGGRSLAPSMREEQLSVEFENYPLDAAIRDLN